MSTNIETFNVEILEIKFWRIFWILYFCNIADGVSHLDVVKNYFDSTLNLDILTQFNCCVILFHNCGCDQVSHNLFLILELTLNLPTVGL